MESNRFICGGCVLYDPRRGEKRKNPSTPMFWWIYESQGLCSRMGMGSPKHIWDISLSLNFYIIWVFRVFPSTNSFCILSIYNIKCLVNGLLFNFWKVYSLFCLTIKFGSGRTEIFYLYNQYANICSEKRDKHLNRQMCVSKRLFTCIYTLSIIEL